MNLHQKQVENVLALPGNVRYKHFIKQVADTEIVWGLYKDGWALSCTENGNKVFPLWPAQDYAELCANNEWADCKPSEIPLNEFLEDLLPNIKRNEVLLGIFYTPHDKGVVIEVDKLIEDIKQELQKYE